MGDLLDVCNAMRNQHTSTIDPKAQRDAVRVGSTLAAFYNDNIIDADEKNIFKNDREKILQMNLQTSTPHKAKISNS